MGRPELLREVQRRFWRLIKEGAPTHVACLGVGVSRHTGERWFRDAGGMPPSRASDPGDRFLSLAEREEIAIGIAAGLSARAIAARLGRAPSTITREVSRNSARKHPGGYRAVLAQTKAEDRARRPRWSKLASDPRLQREVQAGLNQHWSPEQISRRLVEDFPDDAEMRVSHEAIYQALYVQGRGALRRELTRCLRTGRALRKPRRRVDQRQARIKDKVMISERPPRPRTGRCPVTGRAT